MSIARAIAGWLLGAGALSATLVGAGAFLLPSVADGPVVPPLNAPHWQVENQVKGKKQ